ncbi:protein of unknown function [Nitrospina watsonii]|uniref:Uncharacterized protein n=1 Tax=Nitrospina watsonii TaxID=1323948 RepID=A0ABN8VYQ9_9BACT|nr:protein of unknown function [Nitrospina watsonii]
MFHSLQAGHPSPLGKKFFKKAYYINNENHFQQFPSFFHEKSNFGFFYRESGLKVPTGYVLQ